MDPENPTGVQGDPSDAPGHNPAWDEVLSVIPEQFHGVITPHFQKWDQAAQSRITEVNSSLAEFEAYKPFVENGISAEDLEQAIRLQYEIQTNPQEVWKALGEAYNLTPAQQKALETATEVETGSVDPQVAELRQGLELVSQILLRDQESKQVGEAEKWLENELNGLKQKFGEFDEGYVLAMMQNDMSGEDAVNSFISLRDNLLGSNQQRTFAPQILGQGTGGAGLPSNAIDPTKLSGKDTRNLVAQMLEAEFGKRP